MALGQPHSEIAGRNASEPMISLVNELDKPTQWSEGEGRRMGAGITEVAPVDSRGSRDGMLWKIYCPVLETRLRGSLSPKFLDSMMTSFAGVERLGIRGPAKRRWGTAVRGRGRQLSAAHGTRQIGSSTKHAVAASPPREAHAGTQIASCSGPEKQSKAAQRSTCVPSLQKQRCRFGTGGGLPAYCKVPGSVLPKLRYQGCRSGPPCALAGTKTSNVLLITS